MTDATQAVTNYGFCPQCGSAVQATDRACRTCGTRTPVGEHAPFTPRPTDPPAVHAAPQHQPQPAYPASVVTPQRPAGDQIMAETVFGKVTDRRVVFRPTTGKQRGEQDVPLRHVAGVNYSVARHPVLAVVFVLGGLGLLSSGDAAGVVFALIAFAIAVVLWKGRPGVALQTTGGVTLVANTNWRKRAQADHFITKLREQMYRDAEPVDRARWG